ncbi:hypothetical protein L198_02181 [Cryptococcus wingfieldii CBS 7118]|uniref:DNA binding protein Ncp1 n=1 Tax=Cryptococcus wingfieldii CBS 7118 TaxID=1295528 RepID=A0A1E3JRN7_9TREE|nr:hypothetical protein L198_02181 [Cryptococcus wingfieldii CBS 7118]ODO03336.1 hypothetical protein L198_02181 [Cryptococcus wingfieldii CBS 7118]
MDSVAYGLLTRPVLKAVFPSENPISSHTPASPVSTGATSPSYTHSPTAAGPPVLHPAIEPPRAREQAPLDFPEPTLRQDIEPLAPAPEQPSPIQAPVSKDEPVESPAIEQPTEQATHTNMAVVAPQPQLDHDSALANQASGLDLNDRPVSRATQRTAPKTYHGGPGYGPWSAQSEQEPLQAQRTGPQFAGSQYGERELQNGYGGDNQVALGSALAADPSEFREEGYEEEKQQRPAFNQTPSRSYVNAVPIVTNYEPQLPAALAGNRRSVAGSTKAPSVKRASSRAGSIDGTSPVKSQSKRASRAGSVRSSKGGFNNNGVNNFAAVDHHSNGGGYEEPHAAQNISRPLSRAASTRSNRRNNFGPEAGAAGVGATAGGLYVGEYVSQEKQQQLQGANGGPRQYQDGGHQNRTTFQEPQQQYYQQQPLPGRALSPTPRPHSAYGNRGLGAINEGQNDGYANGRESRAEGHLGRSGTVLSRAGTLEERNGTLTRSGTVGSRRGAFGKGTGTSIGTQPEEVLARDDIHTRAELSERVLDEATLRRLSTMEKKDAKRLAKVIKKEAKEEAKSVQASIKELERMVKLQKEAASAERKSQLSLSKWTAREHKARLRFLKEKERYEKLEGELRNAENDYEERRDHAAGLTAQVAEKTSDLDLLRGQKAADDREREVKLLALKNPAHS